MQWKSTSNIFGSTLFYCGITEATVPIVILIHTVRVCVYVCAMRLMNTIVFLMFHISCLQEIERYLVLFCGWLSHGHTCACKQPAKVNLFSVEWLSGLSIQTIFSKPGMQVPSTSPITKEWEQNVHIYKTWRQKSEFWKIKSFFMASKPWFINQNGWIYAAC